MGPRNQGRSFDFMLLRDTPPAIVSGIIWSIGLLRSGGEIIVMPMTPVVTLHQSFPANWHAEQTQPFYRVAPDAQSLASGNLDWKPLDAILLDLLTVCLFSQFLG